MQLSAKSAPDASPPPLTCGRCGSVGSPSLRWQTTAAQAIVLRADCFSCGRYIQYVPIVRAWMEHAGAHPHGLTIKEVEAGREQALQQRIQSAMSGKPVSESQRDLLLRLGVADDQVPADRIEASAMIGRLLKERGSK